MKPMKVTRTERGWRGHFILGHRCHFRRNTLLQRGKTQIVVSTVGRLLVNEEDENFTIVGCDRHFETMAFHSNPDDKRFHDADVSRIVHFDSPWCIAEADAEDKANDMHETVVEEITKRLERGERIK